jgi:hypothetical protein
LSAITIAGDTSGSITLDAPAVAGTTTLTLPATSGTVMTRNSSAPTNSLVVDASGNVGIGTNSPAYKLDVSTIAVATSQSGGVRFGANDQYSLRLGQYTTAGGAPYAQILAPKDSNGYLAFTTGTSDAERMRISPAGDLAVGQVATSGSATGNTADVYAGGLIINPSRRTSSGSSNTVWETSTGQFYRSTSSIKYKQNVVDAVYGLNEVMQLRPVTYEGKSEVDAGKRFGGFIAEEVDAIGLNEFVVYDENNNPDSLGYDRMVSLLTKAIQEQQAIIEQLKADVEALKGE